MVNALRASLFIYIARPGKHRHDCKQLMQPTLNIVIAVAVRGYLFVVFPRSWQSCLKTSFSSSVAFKVMWLRFWAFHCADTPGKILSLRGNHS
ncbi:hypothetical protein [Nostoc sp.]|uniref:hypothetical protein n=1 Tax=Nostoc sp. TaxID=1180 RepID=UPI00359365DC